ncbi:MAG: hypothetical protein QM704_03020 [Anaeromyxobacteraceae bacterium]
MRSSVSVRAESIIDAGLPASALPTASWMSCHIFVSLSATFAATCTSRWSGAMRPVRAGSFFVPSRVIASLPSASVRRPRGTLPAW